MSKLNIEGIIKNIRSKSNIYTPIIEGVVNSIEAIGESGSKHVTIDSTTSWPSNSAGNFYKGTSDTHYRGLYKNDLYDYALRIPMRIYVPGSYNLSIKILNTTHR